MLNRIGVRVASLGTLLAVVLTSAPASAAPVPVRFSESLAHGFLALRGANGDVLAHGEFAQWPIKNQRMESRLTFRFKDGSLWDETVTFTQQRVFRLMSYRHKEGGPSFREATDVGFDRDTGRYRATVDGKTDEGTLELPEDLHNGITGTILRNLAPRGSATGHMFAFTPKPYRLDTQIRVEGEDKFFVGDIGYAATRYLVKMELRGFTGLVASVIGKDPPEVRYWIATGTAPGFVKFEGPMYLKGPRWRIELTSPRWPER